MDNAVKYVHIDGASFKPALCFRGEKQAYAVVQETDRVRTVQIDLKDYDKANPVLYHGEPYNTRAYADRLLMSAKAASKPVSPRARQLLTHLDGVSEADLVTEIELTEEDSIKIISDRSPSERNRAARRPGPVQDVTAAYKAALAAVPDPPPPRRGKAAKAPSRPPEPLKEAPKVPPKGPTALRKTATVGRSGKPAPVEAPPPAKAPKTATKEVRSTVKAKLKYGGRGLVVQQLAHELSTDPKSLRVRLRAAGLRAPYTDITKMRKALK